MTDRDNLNRKKVKKKTKQNKKKKTMKQDKWDIHDTVKIAFHKNSIHEPSLPKGSPGSFLLERCPPKALRQGIPRSKWNVRAELFLYMPTDYSIVWKGE